jgi:hypothetical protein
MNSPTSQDGTGERRWLRWTLAGIAGAALLGAALWLCVAVLPQRLYPSTARWADAPWLKFEKLHATDVA